VTSSSGASEDEKDRRRQLVIESRIQELHREDPNLTFGAAWARLEIAGVTPRCSRTTGKQSATGWNEFPPPKAAIFRVHLK